MPARRGFSLITVLVISVVVLGAVGVVMQFMTVSAGAGRTSSTINRDYNLLVSEVENARASLIETLQADPSAPAPRRMTTGTITSADMLLVMPEDRRVLSQRDLSLYGLGGSTGTLTVKIYDMQYDPADVSMTGEETEQNRLPPSVMLSSGGSSGGGGGPSDEPGSGGGGTGGGGTPGPAENGGAYLIRAYLEIDGVQSGTVDLALMASKNAP
jgi:uncharacterized membrane protein YgcG